MIRRQQWSVFNVPLMWAVAAGGRSCAVLEWLAQSVRDVSILVCGVEIAWARGSHGRVGSIAFGSEHDGLSEWIHGQGSFNHDKVPTSVETEFGHLWPNRLWPNRLWPNRLWPNRLWPNRFWPKPTLAQTDFGQIDFGQTDFGQS